MKNKAFGLDIGTTSLKAVWLSQEKTTFSLESALIIPSPPKGMISESPLDEEVMSQALQQIVTDAKIKTKYVHIALKESQIYTKILEMPVLSDKELTTAIYWEAEQYIPIPLANLTIDYKVLQRPVGKDVGGKMTILLVGAPTMLLNKYEKVITMAGLEITAIETETLATLRALDLQDSSPSSLIISIGSISTSLAIVKHGILVFVYSIPSGSIALSRVIAADFGFSLPQADEYKKTYGILPQNFGGKISKAAEPLLASMIIEVKKALEFYTQKYKDDPIQQIILSGASAKLLGLDSYFASNTGIETVIANPWKAFAGQSAPKEVLENPSEYTVSVGLAMRE